MGNLKLVRSFAVTAQTQIQYAYLEPLAWFFFSALFHILDASSALLLLLAGSHQHRSLALGTSQV